MPITFSINFDGGYLIAAYTGKISDEEMLASWKGFFQGEKWVPGLNELIDLSQADLNGITANGLEQLIDYAKTVYEKHNIHSVRIAVYAPENIHYGLARMYEALTFDYPQSADVFRSIKEAESWLKEKTEE
jgi:hypothetical protein